MKKLTFIDNSNFFARIEERQGGALWLVWGNPNQRVYNEARIHPSKAIILRDFLADTNSGLKDSSGEGYQFEEEFLATRH